MIVNAVERLEGKTLKRLQDFATHLRMIFPAVKVYVYSLPVGTLTDWQGHDVCIDCVLPDVPDDQPDNIVLSVSVFHLTTVPMLSADVVWGNGTLVDEMTEHPIPFTDAALSELERVLPRLTQSIELAISRRSS